MDRGYLLMNRRKQKYQSIDWYFCWFTFKRGIGNRDYIIEVIRGITTKQIITKYDNFDKPFTKKFQKIIIEKVMLKYSNEKGCIKDRLFFTMKR
jgi:hypothetical protein